jgi:ribosome-associated translation inhibitor RaiA
MPARIPRGAKRASGRTASAQTPAHIRAIGVPLDRSDRDYLRRKLGAKLGKFARAIERTSVRIKDVNGPRGGKDKVCRIKVVLSGLPSVVVEERHASLQAAMDRALSRTERAVRRSVQRRRTRAV